MKLLLLVVAAACTKTVYVTEVIKPSPTEPCDMEVIEPPKRPTIVGYPDAVSISLSTTDGQLIVNYIDQHFRTISDWSIKVKKCLVHKK